MKDECEKLFIELVSPYLTAREVAKQYGREDWHGVFAFAEALQAEMISLRKTWIVEPIASDIDEVKDYASDLAEIAVKQEHEVLQGREPSNHLSNEAMKVLGEIQGKLRTVIIDNVCACESGPKVTVYEPGKFPKVDKTLMTLRDLAGGYKITKVHDDGDLTVEAGNSITYVVTTDGKFFPEGQP